MTKQVHSDLPGMMKKLRNQLGLTQEQFAAKVGVTWSTVNRWENGRGKPSPLALAQINEIAREAQRVTADIRRFFAKTQMTE